MTDFDCQSTDTSRAIALESEPVVEAGSCLLNQPSIANVVQGTILYFEGTRYHLLAWCVMPNHVHVVIQPAPLFALRQILHTWKSFTANRINKMLRRNGPLWERESFNHLIRRPEQVEHFIRYTHSNPVEAGLCTAPVDWPFSSCGAGFQPAPTEFRSPSETPFVQPRTRGELPHLQKRGGTYFVTWCLRDAFP